MEELLCVLLDCCRGDLLVLENVGYDLGEIVGQLWLRAQAFFEYDYQ